MVNSVLEQTSPCHLRLPGGVPRPAVDVRVRVAEPDVNVRVCVEDLEADRKWSIACPFGTNNPSPSIALNGDTSQNAKNRLYLPRVPV